MKSIEFIAEKITDKILDDIECCSFEYDKDEYTYTADFLVNDSTRIKQLDSLSQPEVEGELKIQLMSYEVVDINGNWPDDCHNDVTLEELENMINENLKCIIS